MAEEVLRDKLNFITILSTFTFLDIAACNRSMRNSGSPSITIFAREIEKRKKWKCRSDKSFSPLNFTWKEKKKGKIFDSKIIRIRVAINALNILAEKGLSYLKATLINPAAVAAATAASWLPADCYDTRNIIFARDEFLRRRHVENLPKLEIMQRVRTHVLMHVCKSRLTPAA